MEEKMSNKLDELEKEAFSSKPEKKSQDEMREEKKEEEKKKNIKREILSWVEVILISVLLAWFIGNFVIMNAYIPSGSMEDTLHIDDKVIGFRLSYLFSDPERGDVIMFKFPDDETKDYIKRVIGLPGETVTIKQGKVYIDDSEIPLTEDYLKETPIGDFGPYEVPEDSYFVLGDNRNNSADSRAWQNHFVKKEKILAKAIVRWYPLNKMKIITH